MEKTERSVCLCFSINSMSVIGFYGFIFCIIEDSISFSYIFACLMKKNGSIHVQQRSLILSLHIVFFSGTLCNRFSTFSLSLKVLTRTMLRMK